MLFVGAIFAIPVAAVISAFGLVLFTLNGLGFEYLWPNSTWLADKSVPLSICLAQVGMQQFARHFLELRQRWRFGDRVGLGMIAFFVVLGVASTQLPYRVSTPLAAAAVPVVWVVDDVRAVRFVLATALRDAGYAAVEFAGAA